MATQTGSIDLTASNSVKLAAEAGWQSDLDDYYTKSEIDVTVDGINSTVSTKVGEDEVISSINQSSESVSINANKINLQGAVTISDLSSDAQSATLNSNMSVGGRNLVWDTAWNDVANRWTAWGSPTTREIVEIDGKRWLHLVTTTTKYQGYQQGSYKRAGYGEIQAGDTLTISFMAYATVAASDISCIGVHWNKSDGSIYGQTWITTDLTTTPQRFVKTVHIVAGAPVVGFNIMVGDDSAVARELWISEVKLEKGNKATDWTPAPEDVDSAISNAAKTATSYVTDITGGGIMVHPSGDQTTGVKVTDDVDILRDGTSVINVGESDAIRIGSAGNVQMLLESDGLGISNEAGSEIFAIDSGSTGSVTIALDATLVTWNATADVGTTAYTVSDAGAAAGDAVVTATVNGTEYQLDSTYATATVTAGTGVSVALTSAGVTYVRGLMVETVEDDGSTVTTTYPCELTVEYRHAVTDVALLSIIGQQTIDGEGESLLITNSEWVANSRQSGTLMRLHNATTGSGLKLGVGSNGYTRGVFDSRKGDWIIARNRDDKTVINGTNFSVSSGGNVNASGTIASWYQVSARGNGSTSATRRVIALRSNSAGNRGLYDVSLDEWILYKNSSGSIGIGASASDHLHRHESTCTVTTANATVTGGTNHCWHNNAVCTVLIGVNLKSTLANNSTVAIATAPANFRPPYTVVGSVYVTGQAVNAQAWIDSAGKITVNNRSGSTITTSANIYISFTFAL